MPSERGAVAITGMGALSALGDGCDALWAGIAAGRDGIRAIDRFPTEEFSVHLGALVPEEIGDDDDARCVAFAVAAAKEAWSSARVDEAGVPRERMALVVGTGLGSAARGMHEHAERVAEALGIRGPRLTVSTACCSSTNALGLARDLLRSGSVDLVVAGGMDVLSLALFAGFHALGVMCPEKCAPFSEPTGMTLGEGAGMLVLEPLPRARARGAEVLGLLCGYGLAADAYDATSPEPSGAGVARTLRAALADAGLETSAVGYVNLHGTGTAANDPAEYQAVQRVFGAGKEPPVSSSKAHLGHTQGAAGALEAIVTLLAMRRRLLPPTLRFGRPRPGGPPDAIAGPDPRPSDYRHALCTNSAFGGANAAVVLSRADAAVADLPRPRPVRVLGAGAVGGHGRTLDELARALARGEPTGGRVPPFDIQAIARAFDPRALDPSGRYLLAAASAALEDARLRVRGEGRDRAGILMGVSRLSAESERSFWESIAAQGLAHLSATAFKHMVLNAPVGACSLALSLRGPISTLTTGEDSGLVAVAYAAEMLARRRDVDVLLCGGLDELPAAEPADGRGEGAGCLLLGSGDDEPGAIFVSGWGLAGPGALGTAIERALHMAGIEGREVGALFGHGAAARFAADLRVPAHNVVPVLGRAESAGAALQAVAALTWLRRREGDVAVVAAGSGDSGRSASCALTLTFGRSRRWKS
jgi:3-oxoacyl-[acyl-carrier-protein] synthase II